MSANSTYQLTGPRPNVSKFDVMKAWTETVEQGKASVAKATTDAGFTKALENLDATISDKQAAQNPVLFARQLAQRFIYATQQAAHPDAATHKENLEQVGTLAKRALTQVTLGANRSESAQTNWDGQKNYIVQRLAKSVASSGGIALSVKAHPGLTQPEIEIFRDAVDYGDHGLHIDANEIRQTLLAFTKKDIQSNEDLRELGRALGNALTAMRRTSNPNEFNALSSQLRGLMAGGDAPGAFFTQLTRVAARSEKEAEAIADAKRGRQEEFLQEFLS